MHADAQLAHEAGQCAGEQGRFWEYHDVLFANQRALKAPQLKQYAADLELDTDAFDSCIDSGKHRDAVKRDHAAGQAAGVTGTPAFFVNGRFLNGAQPFEAFKQVIDEELELAGAGS